MKEKLKNFLNGEVKPELPNKKIKNNPLTVTKSKILKPRSRNFYIATSILICLAFVSLMLFMVLDLPSFGSADNPAVNEVVQKYVEEGLADTGATNIVAGMILDYRAFDTFGESNVLFLAVVCVLILLQKDRVNISEKDEFEIKEDEEIIKDTGSPVVLVSARILFPLLVMLGIYIILNGHISPGGGFSGGAIIGAAIILFSAAYGFEKTSKFLNIKSFTIINVVSLLTYFSLKSFSFFTGANHLGVEIPKGNPGDILSAGFILPLNICVGLIVACTMYGFYALFSRGEL